MDYRPIVTCGLLLLVLATGCSARRQAPGHQGPLILRWIERPHPNGPSTSAAPANRVHFTKFLSYDHAQKQDYAAVKARLREGDLIAYWMTDRATRRAVLTGHLNTIGYGLLQYGHLAIIVQQAQDPDHPGSASALRLFSSESFVGPNTLENLDTLARHDWDAYRLNQWDRVDTARLHEFVRLVEGKAGHWYGYDFTGMFGLWNSNLQPRTSRRIGHDYICSTVVLAALYYAGVQLDAVRNHGYLDICTPLQVVNSPGRIVDSPQGTLATTDIPTTGTITLRRKSANK